MLIPRPYAFFNVILLLLCTSVLISCGKERSCEGACNTGPLVPSDSLARDSSIYIDTTKIDSVLRFPNCSACDSTKPLPLNTWFITVNNSSLCGPIDSSMFGDPEKRTIDFWGHPECTPDTAFRIVVFFDPLTFKTDRFQVATTSQSFTLQDQTNYMNPWSGNILRTDFSTTPFHTIKVVVDSFNNATKLVVGRFSGYAYTKNNEKSYVDGKFRFMIL